jgi:methylated-DNA-[protein]-cysteine S-methyltransferase
VTVTRTQAAPVIRRTHRVIDSPIGPLTLVAETQGGGPSALAGLYMAVRRQLPDDADIGPPDDGLAAGLLAEAARQLTEYFAGARTTFDLPLAMTGSDFQRRVWTALCDISYGRTESYGALAGRIGAPPGSARAVGLANGRNPISIIVPCHRVIGASGDLTGYGGGLERKKYLLDLERGEVPLAP